MRRQPAIALFNSNNFKWSSGMAIKYRSLIDFGAVLAGNREGINLGLDG